MKNESNVDLFNITPQSIIESIPASIRKPFKFDNIDYSSESKFIITPDFRQKTGLITAFIFKKKHCKGFIDTNIKTYLVSIINSIQYVERYSSLNELKDEACYWCKLLFSEDDLAYNSEMINTHCEHALLFEYKDECTKHLRVTANPKFFGTVNNKRSYVNEFKRSYRLDFFRELYDSNRTTEQNYEAIKTLKCEDELGAYFIEKISLRTYKTVISKFLDKNIQDIQRIAKKQACLSANKIKKIELMRKLYDPTLTAKQNAENMGVSLRTFMTFKNTL